jgi:hypothetical protein
MPDAVGAHVLFVCRQNAGRVEALVEELNRG